jgi:hypothetical protein
MPGARVFARVDFQGGMRMGEDNREATADARGRYEIRGPFRTMMRILTVVAIAEGKPPALAYMMPPKKRDEARPPLDLTLADRGGDLRVAILKDGKPVPGASVQLQSQNGAGMSDPLYVGSSHGPGREAITAAFGPTAQAGNDGVARFRNLYPGLYRIAASESPDPNALARLGSLRGQPFARAGQGPVEPAYALAEGVAVVAGGERSHAMAVEPQSYLLKLRPVAPDVSTPADRHLWFQAGRRQVGFSATFETDDKGIGRYDFGAPGLWAVDIRFREDQDRWRPPTQEPYLRASAVLPMSPALALPDPVELKAERGGSGSIRARLLDADGHPARGTVALVASSSEAEVIPDCLDQ